MSISHFLKLNEKKFTKDLFMVNNSLNFEDFLNNSKLLKTQEDRQQYFHKILGQNKVMDEYWQYQLKIYNIKYQQVKFPILYSSPHLINVINLDIYQLEGLRLEDSLLFYFPNSTLEFKLEVLINGSYSDGYQYEILWKLISDDDSCLDKFWKIIQDKNRCLELSKENKLWELLLENQMLEENIIRDNLVKF